MWARRNFPTAESCVLLVFVGGKACSWEGNASSFCYAHASGFWYQNVRLCMVISVAFHFTALAWKTGTPGLRVAVNLRLFFRISPLDLLERMFLA